MKNTAAKLLKYNLIQSLVLLHVIRPIVPLPPHLSALQSASKAIAHSITPPSIRLFASTTTISQPQGTMATAATAVPVAASGPPEDVVPKRPKDEVDTRLPKLSPAEFRSYNRMADMMEMYVSNTQLPREMYSSWGFGENQCWSTGARGG